MRGESDEIIDWNQSSRELFNFIRALCISGLQATLWISGSKIKINKQRLVEGAHTYKNILGQVIGKTPNGLLIKTGDTMLEITEYTYVGRIRIGDRLKDHE